MEISTIKKSYSPCDRESGEQAIEKGNQDVHILFAWKIVSEPG